MSGRASHKERQLGARTGNEYNADARGVLERK
jgi:hypothetical protein